MDFITVDISCSEEYRDILIAELDVLGGDSFEETETGLYASFQTNVWSEQALQEVLSTYRDQTKIDYQVQEVARKNWNEEWEKNFDPVTINKECIIRAPFHKPTDYRFEIIIMPQMSFGTGHHATTSQVLELQMQLDHQGKSVLDVGTGTGILAIMANKLGAADVEATDVDDWCKENSLSNLSLNGIDDTKVHLGRIADLDLPRSFDIVIANINKNVLINELGNYRKLLNKPGHLLLSGFYQEDIDDLVKEANKLDMILEKRSLKDKWAALQFNAAV